MCRPHGGFAKRKGRSVRRVLTAFALLLPCAIAFGYVGYIWYVVSKPSWSQFGQNFEGFSEVAVGIGIGALTAVLLGALDVAAPAQRWPLRAVALLGAPVVAALIVVAISSYFMFVDTDGPDNAEPYLRALALPAATLLLIGLWRSSQRSTQRESR